MFAVVSFGLLLVKITQGYDDSFGGFEDPNSECVLKYQSPIDVPLSSLPSCPNNDPIRLNLTVLHPEIDGFIIQNDGYSIKAVPYNGNEDNPSTITSIRILHDNTESLFSFNNPLNLTIHPDTNKKYCFDSLHFHWGSTNNLGSEHTFDGIQTPLEVHLVSFSCDYHDIREALTAYTKGNPKDQYILGVIGVQFEVGDPNPALDKMLAPEVIDRVYEYGRKETGVIQYSNAHFDITDLIPGYHKNPKITDFDKTELVMYHGSLTTPPCYEAVRWFVAKSTLTVSESQLAQFRRILNKQHNSSNDNFRPVNPLNKRTLFTCEQQILEQKYNAPPKLANDDEMCEEYITERNKIIVGLTIGLGLPLVACIIYIIAVSTNNKGLSNGSVEVETNEDGNIRYEKQIADASDMTLLSQKKKKNGDTDEDETPDDEETR